MPTVDLKYSPRKWQRKCHANRSRFRVFALHRRAGKALDVNTLIPMASGGFKRMGDLVAGDRVFDETGTPCNVTYAHDVMFNRECYEIKFSDGATIVADADHLWYTETRLEGRVTVDKKMSSGIQQRRKGTTKTTKEILDTLHYCGENNHSIPLSGAVQFDGGGLRPCN